MNDGSRRSRGLTLIGSNQNHPETMVVGIITSRGGAYEKGTAREHRDFQEPYLRHILGFIGLTDVMFVHAENQLREEAVASLAAASERIGEIAADQNRQVVAF